MGTSTRIPAGDDKKNTKSKPSVTLPLIKLSRGAPSVYDALWILPVAAHMAFGLCGKHFVALALSFGVSLSRPHLALCWGWLSQFIFSGAVGGDAFNIPVNISRTENGSNRIPKILVQCLAPYLLYFIFVTFMGDQWIKDEILPSLAPVKVCGYPSGEGATCQTKYCGFVEAIEGTCTTGRAAGCCLAPLDVIVDEVRHNFLMNYAMMMLSPFMGLWVPFWFATIQAAIRLLPSTQLGLISNPNAHLLRAVLSGDWTTLPLVFAAVTIATFLSKYASQNTWHLLKLAQTMVGGSGSKTEGKEGKTKQTTEGKEGKVREAGSGLASTVLEGRDEPTLRKKVQ